MTITLNNTGERQTSSTIEGIKPDHRQRYEFIASNASKEDCVIDFGCGNGYGSFILSEKVADVTAMDISEQAIAFAESHYSNDSKVTFFQQDLCEPLDVSMPGGYTYGVCFEVIEHVEDPDTLLKNMKLMTSRFYGSVPNQDVLPFDKSLFPFHHRHYTPDEIQELLARNGWEIINWYCQYDKSPGDIYPGEDGRTIIFEAVKLS